MSMQALPASAALVMVPEGTAKLWLLVVLAYARASQNLNCCLSAQCACVCMALPCPKLTALWALFSPSSAEIAAGKPVMLRNGQLRNPPPALSTLARMRAAGGGADALAVMAPGADQDGADGAGAVEDRAARLAARRSARDAAAAAGGLK